MRVVATLLAIVVLAGCVTSQSTSQGPGGQSTTQTGLGGYQKTEQWSAPIVATDTRDTWENPFARAAIQLSGQIGPGRFGIALADADGAEVWSVVITGPANVNVQEESDEGAPGTWSVSTTKAAVTGNVVVQMGSSP